MASPFRVFRKHQKVMIATLAILAMVAFVFLDPLMTYLGGSGRDRSGARDPVVVRWADGEIRESDLQRMLLMRRILNHFVETASQLGAMATGSQVPPQNFGPASERAVVQTMLFAKAAQEQGYVVSDEAINRFIQRITNNSVPPARLRSILAQTQVGNRKVTMDLVFAGLRTELMAQALLTNYLISGDSATPLELWLTWQRLNDRARIDVLPLPATSYLDKVAPPTNEQLQAFYDAYKDSIKQPVVVAGMQLESPRPGFKSPRRVAFGYVRADYDPFVDTLVPQITDEEVAKYYEDNKRNFVRPVLLEDEKSPGSAAVPQTPAGEAKTDGPTQDEPAKQPEADAEKAEKPAEPTEIAEPKAEEPAKQSEAGAEKDEKPAEPTETEEPKAEEPAKQSEAGAEKDEKPAEPTETEEPKEEVEPTEGSESQTPSAARRSRVAARSLADAAGTDAVRLLNPGGSRGIGRDRRASPPQPFLLAAYQAEEASAVSDKATAPSTEPEGAATKPAETAASETVQPPKGDASVSPDAAAQQGQQQQTQGGTPDQADTPEPEVEYAPLEEVKEDIRRDLARMQAPEKMVAILKPFKEQMRRYYDELQVWVVQQEEVPEGDARRPRPDPPDAEAWAAEHGCSFEKTARMSYFELEQTDLGQSLITDVGQTLSVQAFDILEDYQPVVSEDRMGNRYLVWRVEETPERTPTLEEIKEEVVAAWKMQRAFELAKTASEQLAEEARSAGKPLDEVFPKDQGHEVFRSDPFSWYTLGPVPGGRDVRLRLSEVDGIDGAGPEFMEAVFKLGDGQVAATVNHSHSVAYVVRLAGREQSEEAMREDFLRESDLVGQMVRQQNAMQTISTLLHDLREVLQVEGWETLDVPRGTPHARPNDAKDS